MPLESPQDKALKALLKAEALYRAASRAYNTAERTYFDADAISDAPLMAATKAIVDEKRVAVDAAVADVAAKRAAYEALQE